MEKVKRMRGLIIGILVLISSYCSAQNVNARTIRFLTNTDSLGLGSTTGILRYDYITGKYRFYNALTSTWFSYITSSAAISGLTANRVILATGPTTIGDNANLTFISNVLSTPGITISSFPAERVLFTTSFGQVTSDIGFTYKSVGLGLQLTVPHLATPGTISVNSSTGTSGQAIISNGTSPATWQAIVNSVFGRTGVVTAQSNDYTFAQIGSKPTTLAGYGITDAQPLNSNLTTLTTSTTGDIIYASGTNTLAKLAAAASGNALLSGTTPSWGKIGLTTHVSGTLPIANGGTNATSFTTDRTLYFNGTSVASTGVRWDNSNGFMGIGVTPNARLQFPNDATDARKIVLYEGANNNHQIFGFGLDAPNDILKYQITNTSTASHVFYAGSSSTTSVELIRITGNGGYLKFPSNNTNARKISLYQVADNLHQIFGFGMDAPNDIMRYQVSNNSTAQHVFYAGTSSSTSNELLKLHGNGKIYISQTPTNDNTETSVLVRQSDGEIQTKSFSQSASTLTGRGSGGGTGSTESITVGTGLSMSGTTLNATAVTASSTYTPTLTSVANVDAVTAFAIQYGRSGNYVQMSGRIEIDPTLVSTFTLIGMSIDIPSDFTSAFDAGGTIYSSGSNQGGYIYSDGTNNRLEISILPTLTSNQIYYFTVGYFVK